MERGGEGEEEHTWRMHSICMQTHTHTHRQQGGTQARLPGCMQRAALLTESFLACALCEKTVGEGERERGAGTGARRYRFKVLRIRAT